MSPRANRPHVAAAYDQYTRTSRYWDAGIAGRNYKCRLDSTSLSLSLSLSLSPRARRSLPWRLRNRISRVGVPWLFCVRGVGSGRCTSLVGIGLLCGQRRDRPISPQREYLLSSDCLREVDNLDGGPRVSTTSNQMVAKAWLSFVQ